LIFQIHGSVSHGLGNDCWSVLHKRALANYLTCQFLKSAEVSSDTLNCKWLEHHNTAKTDAKLYWQQHLPYKHEAQASE